MAKWKDTSFWSVRATVEKSRKMLHKTVREYQKAVSARAQSHFVEPAEQEEKGKQEVEVRRVKDVIMTSSNLETISQDVLVKGGAGQEFGRLAHLAKRARKWSKSLASTLEEGKVVQEVQELLPHLAEEVEKLRSLAPDLKKSKEEQKKQAGFIQQRKRAGLNNLFKTLQNLGFSYRYGLTSCVETVSSYRYS